MKFLHYISEMRAPLMAFAIVGVLFVHSGIQIPNSFLSYIMQIGYGGVDLFFFLSGFGLYYSCKKDAGCWSFWKKRLIRIMPAFIVCLIITQYVEKGALNWTHLWQDCLFVGFWIPPLKWHYSAWFICGIMGLYLIFPFYYKAFRRHPICATGVAILAGLVCAGIYSYYFLVLHPNAYNGYILLLARIPIFFIGVLFGYYHRKETQGTFSVAKVWRVVWLVLPIAGYMMHRTFTGMGFTYAQIRNSGAVFYPFILMVPGFAIAMGWIVSHAPSFIRKVLGYIGGATLESYLLLGAVFHYRKAFILWAGDSNIAGCLLMIAACIIAGCVVHYVISKLISYLPK